MNRKTSLRPSPTALLNPRCDASFKAIDNIIQPPEHTFDIYTINSISEGKDTLGNVTVKLKYDNRSFTGQGLSTDIIEGSILAYIKATNKMLAYIKRKEESV